MLAVRVPVRKAKSGEGEVRLNCCCQYYGELEKLLESGEDDERLHDLMRSCAEQSDPYALYLNAAMTTHEYPAEYVVRMEKLAQNLNPWALADLALYYLFDKQDEKNGGKYLLLGALFGEKRAQFYLGYKLTSESRNFGHRLIKASADQNYKRAIDFMSLQESK